MEWSDGAMATLKHVWKEGGPSLIAMPKQTLTIGQVSLAVVVHFSVIAAHERTQAVLMASGLQCMKLCGGSIVESVLPIPSRKWEWGDQK